MTIKEYMKDHLIFLDGGMGTMLQQAGLDTAGKLSESWTLTHPEIVESIHRAYYDAGSHVVYANTFGVNGLKYDEADIEALVGKAVSLVKNAAAGSSGTQPKFVALDLGPLGRLIQPFGDLAFEAAVSAFAPVVRAGVRCGVDLIVIETMNDSYETKAAVIAAKENADLPVFVTNAYSDNGKLMTGADPAAMAALLEGLRVDALGINCAYGPETLMPQLEAYLDHSDLPVIFKPNAGLPHTEEGKTIFDIGPQAFAQSMVKAAQMGARILGGCCGTTPDYIRAIKTALEGFEPKIGEPHGQTVVSSNTHALVIGENPIIIGERINPTGKKAVKAALRNGDLDQLFVLGIQQQNEGAHALDVNVGLPGIDEADVLDQVVTGLQGVVDLPLQIDSADPAALALSVRHYNGKPLINSVNGKKESMDQVFPVVARYGGVVVALTLDEEGIPSTVEGRMAIAERIIAAAADYGIEPKDLIFDPLTLAVSADPGEGMVTLETVTALHQRGYHTVLGVSNISFGLPERNIVNCGFLASALERGLNAAIMNPASAPMQQTLVAYRLLHGLDPHCQDYIAFASGLSQESEQAVPFAHGFDQAEMTLNQAIVQGLKARAGALTTALLDNRDPMDLLNQEVIPALDQVGRDFEAKKVYLPQLLMSAEAASAAFEVVRNSMSGHVGTKSPFVLATVQGDIHDIGKNIVRLLLENYGFQVHDLGKDVPPERILAAVQQQKAPLVGLCALMTTTLPSMEKTIGLIKKEVPQCHIIVGGAVVTETAAKAMGADDYAKDAMAVVRISESVDQMIQGNRSEEK